MNYTKWMGVIAVALFASACSNAPKDKETRLAELRAEQEKIAKQITELESEIGPAAPAEIRAKGVIIEKVTARPFNHFLKTQGRVEAQNNILVSARSMGAVTRVLVEEGQTVVDGQTLAQIDNTLILRSIESMKTQMELAKTIFERQKNLWDQKIGTEVQFLQAKTNKENLEKQLAVLQEQNDMTRIKSPISGKVDHVFVKVGENIAPGMPAVRVVNNSELRLVANVSEEYVTELKAGNKAVVSFPGLQKEIEAKVTFVGSTIDPLSRTFTIEAYLPGNSNLKPNMTGIVKIIYYTAPSAVTVPINVVQTVNDEKVVFVAEAQGPNMVARKRVVKVAGVFDNTAQIDSGISAGDKIITFGYQGLSDGQYIKM